MSGWFTFASAVASAQKRLMARGSARLECRTLIATSRPSVSSTARYTVPMPPCPRRSRMRYLPKGFGRTDRVSRRPRARRFAFMRSRLETQQLCQFEGRRAGAGSGRTAPITKWNAEVNRPHTHFVKAHMTISGDLRLALRGLRRSPLFATVAILSLALGIGANTAIFTLIDQVLLRKLPVANPDRPVMLHQQGSHNGANMGSRMHSYPMYQDIQQR